MLAAVVLFVARPGCAEEQEPPAARDKVRLYYRAPPDCPAEQQFLALVRARAAEGWEAGPEDLAHRIDVDVFSRDDRYVAAIRFSGPTGELVTRSVAGASCADVVNAIALVTALAIEARVDELIRLSEPSETTPVIVPEPKAAPTPGSPPPVAARPRAVRPPPLLSARFERRFGVLGSLQTGVGPEPALGIGAFLGQEWRWAVFGLAFTSHNSGRVDASGVPTEFRLLSLRLDGCPLSFGDPERLAFEPCLLGEAGSLRGQTFRSAPRVVESASGSALWAATGALARLVVGLDPLMLELEAIGRAPLVRERFYVRAGTRRDVVFRVPPLSWGASLGIGARF